MKKKSYKKYRFLSICLLLLIVTLAGCMIEERTIVEDNTPATITLKMVDKTEVTTRGASVLNNENLIDNLFVLVFRNTGSTADPKFTYVLGEKLNVKTHLKPTDDGKAIVSTGLRILSNDRVVILCNTNVTELPKFTLQDTEDVINDKFNSSTWAINQTGQDNGKGMPMSGIISNWNSVRNECMLKCAVAKIQVKTAFTDDSKDLTKNFIGTNADAITWGVYNQVEQGSVYNAAKESIEIPSSALTFKNNALSLRLVGSTAAGSKAFYLPEFPSSVNARGSSVLDTKFSADRTCIILKTNGGFYRLDLFNSKFLDIKRNHNYIIHITKVNSNGYSTAQEAAANPGSNLEYEIAVEDNDDFSSITSNGQYGIGVEKDDVTVYGSFGERVYKITDAQILGDAKAVTTNTVTVSQGLELVSLPELSENLESIQVKFTDSNIPTGEITLNLGNITKKIQVKKEPYKYRSVTVFGAGKNSLDPYGFNVSTPFNPASKWGQGANRILTAPGNFGVDGTFSCEPVKFILPNKSTMFNITEYLESAIDQNVEIIVMAFDVHISETLAKKLTDYVNKGGVFVMFCEGNGWQDPYSPTIDLRGGSVTNFMREFFQLNTIDSRVVNIKGYQYPSSGKPTFVGTEGGMLYRIDPDHKVPKGDPILDGPFYTGKDGLRGKNWGEDVVYARAVENLPLDQIVVYSDALVDNIDITAQDPNQKNKITAFRHKTKNLIFVGDGGFISSPPDAFHGNEEPGYRVPLRWGDNNEPVVRENYGNEVGNFNYKKKDVYNSHMYANIMAWAIERAVNNGINKN